ncbi:MAG: spore cortex-lytic protein, partial [Ruminococcaceae bacterium]|nr:spore cortex-lytic protein [Oscillospiraceae bacterium]
SSNAENVTLPFAEYIANVASSEIYPTWNENAIRANIYAQISFALNRVYTEYYRSRGYPFDITNSTTVDQSFVKGRDIYENVNAIVSELFNDYIRRQGNIEPLFASYCDGIRVTCAGLSQWGSEELAQNGRTPYEILTYYYGDDIDLVRNAEVRGITESYPEVPLRLGSSGTDVRQIQVRLNRISANYSSIPKIVSVDGIFSYNTEDAVIAFQEAFNLTPDGIVGKATWYKIQQIYASIKRLAELNSEGISPSDITQLPYELPSFGDTGLAVQNVQYYLNYLSRFYSTIPPVNADGIFGEQTRNAILSAQRTFGLSETGELDAETFEAIYDAYLGIIDTLSFEFREGEILPFAGVVLNLGSEAPEVEVLQQYLNALADTYPEIPRVNVTGYFGSQTEAAVLAFQRLFGYQQNGVVEATVWNAIASEYQTLYAGGVLREGQNPGYEVGA